MKSSLIWNYGSMVCTVGAALACNLMVAAIYGPSGTGILGERYAVFLIAGQLGTFGIHYSMLANISKSRGQLVPGLVGALFISVFVASLLFFTTKYVYVAWSIPWFAANKVFLNGLIGLGRMKTYALGQAVRAFGLFAAVLGMCLGKTEAKFLPLAFLISESISSVVIAWMLRDELRAGSKVSLSRRLMDHLKYGLRGFPSGFAMEVHARVDVLIVSMFFSGHELGIYVFAGMLAEGFFLTLYVFRNVLSVKIAECLRGMGEFRALFLKYSSRTWGGMALLAVVLFSGILMGAKVIPFDPDFVHSIPIAAIMMCGILLGSGVLVFDTTLLHSGKPGTHSVIWSCMLVTNAVLNLALIPGYGLKGAAFAMACSYVVGAVGMFGAMFRLGCFVQAPRAATELEGKVRAG
jgi:O-antigen/teichoic acid export membrane protein